MTEYERPPRERNRPPARLHAFLLQTFFHLYMDENNIAIGGPTSALFRALGKANDFFFGDGQTGPSFAGFREWAEQSVIAPNGSQRAQILSWLPPSLRIQGTLDDWITTIARDLIAQLEAIMRDLQLAAVRAEDAEDDNDDEGAPDDDRNALGDEELLEFLFSRGMLPSYAFPTDLTSFLVERLVPVRGSPVRECPGTHSLRHVQFRAGHGRRRRRPDGLPSLQRPPAADAHDRSSSLYA